ncbi:MAG: GGDEF domain-containing protein [Methylococcales bacterium]
MTTLRQALANTELFQDIPDELLQQVLEHANPLKLKPGLILLSPEVENHHIYILLSGLLTLHFNSPDSPSVKEFQKGQSVGELSIIDNMLPSGYVKTQKSSLVFPVHRDFLHNILTSINPVTRNLLRLLTRRMKDNIHRTIIDQSNILNLTHQANIDALTGLFNRRWLDNAIPRFLAQAAKLEQPLCLLMIDIDHFKNYNDTQGHLGGDHALIQMGNLLQTKIRPNDFAVRYGGEEFMVVLSNTRQSNGIIVAENIRLEIEKLTMTQADGSAISGITASIGLALSNPDSSQLSIIAEADKNLYRAKQNGRNCVKY